MSSHHQFEWSLLPTSYYSFPSISTTKGAIIFVYIFYKYIKPQYIWQLFHRTPALSRDVKRVTALFCATTGKRNWARNRTGHAGKFYILNTFWIPAICDL